MVEELKADDKPDPAAERQGLVAVDIYPLRNVTRDISFDVYLKLNEDNFAHVFSRTTGLDYKRLAQYIQKGVKKLFIKKDDFNAYQDYISRTADIIFNDPKTSQEKKIATLLNMTEQNMAELFAEIEVDDETSKNTQQVITNYVKLMTDSPQSLAILLKLVAHGEYFYYHSIAVSVFSMFIAKASGQFNKRTLELVGLGGFLHDIGHTQLPKEINESTADLTPEQWKLMKTHPKIGLKMLEKTSNIPDEVRHIVYQHHEQPNGQGYPNGLRSPVIYYPAKIVALADSFSALISRRPFRDAHSVADAIKVIKSEEGKFDRDLVKILGDIFIRQTTKAA